MKMKPDENTLTQWMDGELEGDELQRVEKWAQEHPELLAEREAIQSLSSNLREHIADSVEPPYPDFFNQRILRTIEEDRITKASPSSASPWKWLQWLSAPLAAGAMAICFYVGTQVNQSPTNTENPVAIVKIAPDSTIYTPDGTVRSAMFKTSDAEATVIVLEGLDDLPDELEMAGEPSSRPSGSMMIHSNGSEHTY